MPDLRECESCRTDPPQSPTHLEFMGQIYTQADGYGDHQYAVEKVRQIQNVDVQMNTQLIIHSGVLLPCIMPL